MRFNQAVTQLGTVRTMNAGKQLLVLTAMERSWGQKGLVRDSNNKILVSEAINKKKKKQLYCLVTFSWLPGAKTDIVTEIET